ncbi:hypothetical protein CLU79DRAFT_709035 [Phycomyces nitens]|nr:hypothetical protein CLU79DRAFT_709035 [Phycomyces nitens]
MRPNTLFNISVCLLFGVTWAQVEDNERSKNGGITIGTNNDVIPDSSAEHPMVVSHPDDQPLCTPKVVIEPSQPLRILDGYEAFVLTNDIKSPRKTIVDHANHALVISGTQSVYSIRMDECGNPDVKQILTSDRIGDQPLGNGIALYGDRLYITTANALWSFEYSDGQHTPLGQGVLVIDNLNPSHGEAQPDIAIDPFGKGYIPRSVQTVTESTEAEDAIIKVFDLDDLPEEPLDYESDGKTFAIGTNTHGYMGFDTQGRLWGVELLANIIKRPDMFGDVYQTGLATDINLYEFPSKNYGFPYCFTEYDLEPNMSDSKGKGSQWGLPMFANETGNIDLYCENNKNNQGPAIPVPSNTHAVGILFYGGNFCSIGNEDSLGTSVGLPCSWTDTPLVAYHGVDGKEPGHSVVHLPVNDLGHKPEWDKTVEVVLEAEEACGTNDGSCISPVGLAVDKFGRLLVSSDTSDEIFIVYRTYNEDAAKELTDEANKKEALADQASENEEEEESKEEESKEEESKEEEEKEEEEKVEEVEEVEDDHE